MAKPIPDGFHTVTPFFMSNDVEGLAAFLKESMGAKITSSIKQKNRRLETMFTALNSMFH